jgi:hypothetical protein
MRGGRLPCGLRSRPPIPARRFSCRRSVWLTRLVSEYFQGEDRCSALSAHCSTQRSALSTQRRSALSTQYSVDDSDCASRDRSRFHCFSIFPSVDLKRPSNYHWHLFLDRARLVSGCNLGAGTNGGIHLCRGSKAALARISKRADS